MAKRSMVEREKRRMVLYKKKSFPHRLVQELF